jgi:hypothetical protein
MDIPEVLKPKRLGHRGGADYDRALYFLNLGPGVTPEMVMDEEFWRHLAARFKVNDRLEIVAPDFDMDVRVVAVDPRGLWAKMRELRRWPPEGVEARSAEHSPASSIIPGAPDQAGYIVEWGGPKHMWRILRGSDLIDKGFPDKDAAHAKLAEIQAELRAA